MEGGEVQPEGSFLAQVFKIVMGDFGAQSYIRVFSGEISRPNFANRFAMVSEVCNGLN